MSKTYRLIFSLSAETSAKLEELRFHMGLKSRAEVIRALVKRAHRQLKEQK